MDPWLTKLVDQSNTHHSKGEDRLVNGSLISYEDQILKNPLIETISEFEDQFVISTSLPFEKLPDSKVYLASLEKKLKKVQSGGQGKGASASIIRSLEETRESSMIKLLTDTATNHLGNHSLDNLDFDELKVNPLLKIIAPEKQPVALEELVHLLKADQLSILLEQNSQDIIPTTIHPTDITEKNQNLSSSSTISKD